MYIRKQIAFYNFLYPKNGLLSVQWRWPCFVAALKIKCKIKLTAHTVLKKNFIHLLSDLL